MPLVYSECRPGRRREPSSRATAGMLCKTTIGSASAVSSMLLLLLLCFSSVSCTAAAAITGDPLNPRRMVMPAPSTPSRTRRRRLGQDKEDGKNQPDSPTTAPSSTPSFSPSTRAPTKAPSTAPTEQPSLSPSTDQPSLTPTLTMPPSTSAPTNAPSFGPLPGSVGNLILTLSVVDTSSSSSSTTATTTAADILEGRAPAVTQAVLGSLVAMLCKEMNVRVVTDADPNAPNYCTARRRLNVFQEDSIVLSTARLTVVDNNSELLTWTEWTVYYPVLQVGEVYWQTALQNGGGTMSEEELTDEGLRMFQSVAQLALSAEIQDATLHADWPEPYESSPVGREVETYGAMGNEQKDGVQGGYTQELDPDPLHALRVAGVVMLALTLVLWFGMLKISKRRRLEREWDKEYIERGRGGLVTEEGLDYMLEVGRRESLKLTQEEEDEDQTSEEEPFVESSSPVEQESPSVDGTGRDMEVQPDAKQDSSGMVMLSSILNLGNAPANDDVDDEQDATNSALWS